jgi:hypothetical protein
MVGLCGIGRSSESVLRTLHEKIAESQRKTSVPGPPLLNPCSIDTLRLPAHVVQWGLESRERIGTTAAVRSDLLHGKSQELLAYGCITTLLEKSITLEKSTQFITGFSASRNRSDVLPIRLLGRLQGFFGSFDYPAGLAVGSGPLRCGLSREDVSR